ncbi:hypothetical protein Q5P01_007573 [Channa striata]|uniref:Endonuclease/exonuclease/phosphatase domain-containing protein n=1 Tax=Channa striata TaxID=64152 RepID=A0AA88N9I6_CHASR|nr:hypothetical protein Q5P01_007573 [Channa striata]
MRTAVLLLVAGLCALNVTVSLKICAFNVQSFGESKPTTRGLWILSRCDLCLIQEVRDSKGEAVKALVQALNRFDRSNSYSHVESERLGRKTYKEQYVYVYRNNVLKVKDHYQYPKEERGGINETDVFSRDPFIVRFHSPTTLVKDFVLIGQHTCPKTAMKEMDELYTVFKGVYKKWKTDNVIILGDLNAGCGYVTIEGWRAVRLRGDPKFHWLIGDEQDTAVREKKHCAYDRIIVHGREIISSIVPGSAQPFNFKEHFHLTEKQLTKMEQSLSELLSDAFSETSVPCLEDGDLDFENLNFDERFENENTDTSHKNLPTKEDRALHQETTGEATVSYDMENKDMAQNAGEEQFEVKNEEEDYQGVGISLAGIDKRAEEDYTSLDRESEEESSDSGDDVEKENIEAQEELGDLVKSFHYGDNFYYDNKEDNIFAEGQFLAPEGTENSQFRNEEQGECDSEEVCYFGQVPERGNGMATKGDGTEEDEQAQAEEAQDDSSDSESEDMKIIVENVAAQSFEQEVESPYRDVPIEASLEFPDISVQNLQDLVAEVDSEEYVEKMKDFSGEEHQEAGEGFADYPSDFSSCEYVEGEGTNQEDEYKSKNLPCPERVVTDVTWLGREENTDEEGDGYLYSRDLEMDADRMMSMDTTSVENDRTNLEVVKHVTECDDGVEAGESDSYSSSDDEFQVRRRDEEVSDSMCLQDLDNTQLYSESGAAFSTWSISDDPHFTNNGINLADFNINVDFDLLKTDSLLAEELLTTEDTDVSQHPADDINSYSVVQREDSKTICSAYQGSLDDSFFFNTELEVSGVSEQGQLGDDEYEEERNWEQEQERIKAFYKFYDDSDGENGREERQIKVQFCSDPLSQVIHYETESSSDRDSLSSSTDREEDLSATETSEEPREPDNTLQIPPAFDPPCVELPESVPEKKLSNTRICTGKHKCLGVLKLILMMVLVVLMGLLMFWLTTDQADWLSHVSFFKA